MLKNFWNSLSIIEKDLLYNAIWSTLVATYISIVYDVSFLRSWLIVFGIMYIMDTINYFRKYLTNEKRYTINIDNTHNVDSLTKKIVLNLYNPQWDKTHSWSFTANESEDGKLKDSTDWV